MDVRYQVFVSSTFVDLQDERSAVFQTLMEMDCIPAGMELFPAMDEEQWNFIKRVIDDCDYYILILGGRYGSVSSTGVSYTEMEYDYAIEKGIKVLPFVHEAPEDIPSKFTDSDPALREKLEAFRSKAKTGRLVKFWRETKELPGLVALSLNKTIKTYPAVGWVRADKVSSEADVMEQNKLLKENEALRAELENLKLRPPPTNLADIEEKFTVPIYWSEFTRSGNQKRYAFEELTWKQIFTLLGPELQKHPNDSVASNALGEAVRRLISPNNRHSVYVRDDAFQTIRIQLEALGLVRTSYLKTTGGSMALFWTLTPTGTARLIEWRTVKSAKAPDNLTSPAEAK